MSHRLSVVFALVGSLSAQTTWVVECASPLADFADLPDAVAAAAAGDTIVVARDQSLPCPGFEGYTACVVDKPLRIVGASFETGWRPGVRVLGLFEIENIPAGQDVVLADISVRAQSLQGPTVPFGFAIRNCAGRVVLEDVDLSHAGQAGTTMSIHDCEDVLVRGSFLVLGGQPMDVVATNLTLQATGLWHTAPATQLLGVVPFPTNAEGMRLTDATVSMFGSIVQGGAEWVPLQPSYQPMPGATLQNSTLEVGPDSGLFGGHGVVVDDAVSYRFHGSGGGTVLQDPRTLIPSLPQPSQGPSPIPGRIDAVVHDDANPNAPLDVYVAGPPAGYAILAVGDYQRMPVSTPQGLGYLVPGTETIVACQPLDVEGEVVTSLFVPAGSAVGRSFCLQAMTLDAQGAFRWTRPSVLVLGWAHGVAPY